MMKLGGALIVLFVALVMVVGPSSAIACDCSRELYTCDAGSAECAAYPCYEYCTSLGMGGIPPVSQNDGTMASELPGSSCPPLKAPVADFTADTRVGSAPFTVQFMDTSTGKVTDRYWDFTNDGSIDSQEANPVFTYPEEGTYSVRLIVVSCMGWDIEVKTDYISVIPGPTITVVTPNGGENWEQGSTQTIRWNYTSEPGSMVNIEVLKGVTSLATFHNIPVGSLGQGSYPLTFPYNTPLGSDFRIRVTSTSYSGWRDTSDAPFTISVNSSSSLTVTAPDGGENYLQGSVLPIHWTYDGNPGPTVNIEVLKGTSVLKVLPDIPIGSDGSGSYSMTIPLSTPVGSEYQVRVTSAGNPVYSDASDDPFTISSPTITVAAPNGGDTYLQGSTQTIQWDYTGDPGPTVKIEALRGDAVLATIASSYPLGSDGSGSYNLTFPYSTPVGSDYRIRVTSTSNPAWTDTSDTFFGIIPAITVTSPDGGETWQPGSTHPITWTYSGAPGTAVKIEALRGETVLAVVTPSTPIGSGSYSLTFPANTPLGNDYRIRITSTSNPACTDTSNGMFAISG